MKILLFMVFVIIGMSGCSAHNPNGSYERANVASEKAHSGLDKE